MYLGCENVVDPKVQNKGRGRSLVVAESFESVIDSRDLGTTDTAPNGSPSTLQLHLVQSCSPNHGSPFSAL